MNTVRNTIKNQSSYVPSSLSSKALLGKSRLYAARALNAKAMKDAEVYQIWAALALELLGKAQLADIHPSLVVEPDNTNSLLEACGIETDTVVKTVNANVVFARLKHTVNKFGTPHAEACKAISARRNAELHSGQAAYVGMVDKDWEGQFWSTAQLILASMDLELEDWIGHSSKMPGELAQQFREIKFEAAKQRIANDRTSFLAPGGKKRSKGEIEALRRDAATFQVPAAVGCFRYILDHHWQVDCPACECNGFLGGDRLHEEVIDHDYETGFETVERFFTPVEFLCQTCGLRLEGSEEMEAAEFDTEYSEVGEREMEYEPDYGND